VVVFKVKESNMKTLLTQEGWIALLGVIVTAVGAILNAVLPADLQALVEWILLVVQGVGMLLILIFARKTTKLLARLKAK
jgi:hypothetical protein